MAGNKVENVRFAPDGRILVKKYEPNVNIFNDPDVLDPTKSLPVGPSDWHELGYATTDGVELTPSIETQEIEAWQSATPIMYSVQSASLQVKATLMEVNPAVTETYFGTSWTEISEGVFGLDIESNPELSQIVLVVEWSDKDIKNRLVIPHAIVSDRDSITLQRTESQNFGLTVDALDENGTLAKLLTTKDMSGASDGDGTPPGTVMAPAAPQVTAKAR